MTYIQLGIGLYYNVGFNRFNMPLFMIIFNEILQRKKYVKVSVEVRCYGNKKAHQSSCDTQYHFYYCITTTQTDVSITQITTVTSQSLTITTLQSAISYMTLHSTSHFTHVLLTYITIQLLSFVCYNLCQPNFGQDTSRCHSITVQFQSTDLYIP